MPEFPSAVWVTEFVAAINGSDAYRAAATEWEGDVSFVVQAEPDRGFDGDVWVWLDLWHGRCRAGRVVVSAEGGRARYIISAPYSRWRRVLRGELDPVKGMMQGKLRVRGDLPTIVRYVAAANELVRLAGTVETTFVGEAAG